MRRLLAGLKKVCVVVERFKPAQEKVGFDGTAFEMDVEQLRSAGITVLSVKQAALIRAAWLSARATVRYALTHNGDP